MNRKLLLTLLAGASLSGLVTGAPKNLNKVAKFDFKQRASLMRADGEYSIQSYNLNPNVAPAAAMQMPTGPISLVEMGSSPNLYTALVSEAHCLTANQDLNLIAFNRRRNNTTFGNSGFVQASYSTNAGMSFDSTLTVVGDSADLHLCRYPSGAILNPIGNTNPQNAYIVAAGPWHPGANWQGNFFSSRQVNGSNYSPFFQDNTTQGANDVKSDFARISAQATNDEVFHIMGGSYDDANQTTWAAQGYRYAVLHTGKLNHTTNSLDWTSRAFPHAFRHDPADDTKSVSSVAHCAWSQDGSVGYVVYLGEDSITYDALKSFQPIVYKTTDFGATWNMMPMYNFSDLVAFKNTIRSTRQGTKRAFFSTANGVSTTVDMNNDLHIVSGITAASTDQPDSLDFTWSIPTIIADVKTSGNNWEAIIVDSLITDVVADADSPWQPSDGTAGNGWDARIQVSRSQDGKRIFYGWMDTDTTWGVTTNQFPDIYAKGLNVETGKLTQTHNFTSADNALHGKMNWMFMQTITLKDSVNYNLGFSTTTSYDGSFDALAAVKHYYVKGIMFNDSEFNIVSCTSFGINKFNISYPTTIASTDGSVTAELAGGTPPFTYAWSTSPAQTSATAIGLGNDTYTLVVTDSVGCSSTGSINLSTVGIQNVESNKFVQLFPNPTTGVVNIRIDKAITSTVNVAVTSVDGSVVMSKNFDASTLKSIDLSAMAKGLYFVKVTVGNKSNIVKITKQ